MKLLIADDEITIRKGMLSLPWNEIGIEKVYEAENGLQAKELLIKEAVDIIISDIRMPGFTGLELAEYVKECGIDCAVILLTGFSEFEYAQQAIKNQVADYMLKPLMPKDILETVSRAIDRLKRNRYQESIVRQHEAEMNGPNLERQISHYFHGINAQVSEILNDMAQSFSQDITLNSFAEKYHFSISYLSRLIKRETGYGFSDLLNSIRILHAINLLEDTSVRIGDISEQSGFQDVRYFSQIFKKVVGCTPREYKRSRDTRQTYNLKLVLELLQEKK